RRDPALAAVVVRRPRKPPGLGGAPRPQLLARGVVRLLAVGDPPGRDPRLHGRPGLRRPQRRHGAHRRGGRRDRARLLAPAPPGDRRQHPRAGTVDGLRRHRRGGERPRGDPARLRPAPAPPALCVGAMIAHGPVAPSELWSSWNPEPTVVVGLLLAAVAYARGYERLRTVRRPPVGAVHAACFAGALAALVVALLSPLDAAAASL